MTLNPLSLRVILDLHVIGRIGDITPPKKSVVDSLYAQGIVDRPDEFCALTPKGEAWLAAILVTPMPVPQWVVPGRENPEDIEKLRFASQAQRGLLDYIERPNMGAQPEGRIGYPVIKPAAPIVEVPQGFEPVHTSETSRAPQGITAPADQYVQVIHRDGINNRMRGQSFRPSEGFASQFNWQHNGGDDDIVGWRFVDPPENKQHVGTSTKSQGAA